MRDIKSKGEWHMNTDLICKNEKQVVLFCQDVKILRERSGFSEREMAKILGIDIPSLEKIEQGILPPRIGVSVIFKILRYFKIEPCKLFTIL